MKRSPAYARPVDVDCEVFSSSSMQAEMSTPFSYEGRVTPQAFRHSAVPHVDPVPTGWIFAAVSEPAMS